MEETVRAEGAVPATCAIVKGRLKVGLTAQELEIMCRAENVGKVSRRDVAVYVATGRTGATTVASTMLIAAMANIPVFATGGIGGVHRGGEDSMDISADLQELATARDRGMRRRKADFGYWADAGISGNHGRARHRHQTEDFPALLSCRKSGYGGRLTRHRRGGESLLHRP